MEATVFLMCHNEKVMIAQTIHHYRTMLRGCEIVICDNESSDGSARIARELGCSVYSFATSDAMDNTLMQRIRNNVWKYVSSGWVIMCDMDEYLCVNHRQLLEEEEKGTTVLTTRGFDIIGNSTCLNLDDADITLFDRGFPNDMYSKNVCFKREGIAQMNYEPGCHHCRPEGTTTYSEREYALYHMNCLGLPHYVRKNVRRYARSHENRKKGLSKHYSDDTAELANRFRALTARCQTLPTLASMYVSGSTFVAVRGPARV